MGFKNLLRGRDKDKPLLIGGGAELELHKHFKIVRRLGAGSYSTVYEVERLTDGHHYALKMTEMDALPHLDKVAVVEEIRLLASLHHPNLISYYEAFLDHGKLCVVTELVEGGDLGSFLRKTRGHDDFLWERQVWDFFLQAVLGVQYLHHNHVLHRDLKPQNIMLTKKGGLGSLLKIVDLGVSAELARVFTKVQIGTPHYMAPEMWKRQPYSYSADIWALGCILHELCTLRPTFLTDHTRTEADIKLRVLAGAYERLPSRYSIDIARLVALMLQQDPKDRPTIDEILDMPAVRAKFGHLPPQLQPLAAMEHDDIAKKEKGLPQLPVDMQRINCMLPPARYATGTGVASLMMAPLPGGRRRSLSLSDLQHAAAAKAAATGGGQQQVAAAEAQQLQQQGHNRALLSAAGWLGASSPPEGGEPPPRGMTLSGSMGTLALEEEEGGKLRRRSIMVGDLQFWMHQDQQQQQQQGQQQRGAVEECLRHTSLLKSDGGEGQQASIGGVGSGGVGVGMGRPDPLAAPPSPRTAAAAAAAPAAAVAASNAAAGGGDGGGHRHRQVAWAQLTEQGRGGGGFGGGGGSSGGGSSGEAAWGRSSPDRDPSSLGRSSVTVAEVMWRQKATQVRERSQHGSSDLARAAATPLDREPFEYCATTPSQPHPLRPATPTSRAAAAPAAASSSRGGASAGSTGANSGGGGDGRAPAAAATAASAGGAVASAGTQQQLQQQRQQQPVIQQQASKEEKKKKKKHGRLWRLMHGEYGDTGGMHQEWAQ